MGSQAKRGASDLFYTRLTEFSPRDCAQNSGRSFWIEKPQLYARPDGYD